MTTYKYSGIRPTIKNGDVVLFRGKGFVSGVILSVQSLGYALYPKNWKCGFLRGLWSKWSHVGTIVRVPYSMVIKLLAEKKLPEGAIVARREEGKDDIVLLFESTSINGGFSGVQLRLLSDALKDYKGKIQYRRLVTGWNADIEEADRGFIETTLGKNYERHIIELARSAFKIIDQKPNDKYYFCSELCAGRFQRWGILPPVPAANKYAPEDFRSGGLVDRRLVEAKLEREITVKI